MFGSGAKPSLQVVAELSRAFALCAASDEATAIRDDIFTAAGLPRPDIGILSEQFLAEVRGLKYKT